MIMKWKYNYWKDVPVTKMCIARVRERLYVDYIEIQASVSDTCDPRDMLRELMNCFGTDDYVQCSDVKYH